MANWNELTRVQMPALIHLTRIGYTYFGKIPSKMPLSPNEGAERRVYANRASQAKKDHRHLV